MSCPACATVNAAGSRFCGGCGAALHQLCAACGGANDRAMQFTTEGRADEARPLLDEARQTFEHLRARPWIERVARLAPSPRPAAAAARA